MDITITLKAGDTSFGRRFTATEADTSGEATSSPWKYPAMVQVICRFCHRIRFYWRWWLHHLLVQVDVSSTKVGIPHQNA